MGTSTIRPRQRALTALFPHQGNQRVLVPNRSKFGTGIPLFGYRFDGLTMSATTSGGFVPRGFPFSIGVVIYTDTLPEAGDFARLWSGLTNAMQARWTNISQLQALPASGGASTIDGVAIQQRHEVIMLCDPDGTLLRVDGNDAPTAASPADIGLAATGLSTLASNVAGVGEFHAGWVARVVCWDRSPMQDRVVAFQNAIPDARGLIGTLINCSNIYRVEFDWVRQQDAAIRMVGTEDGANRVVLADSSTHNVTLFASSITRTWAGALADIAIGQAARYRIQRLTVGGPLSLYIDDVLIGDDTGLAPEIEFLVDQIGGAGPDNPYQGGMGNMRLENLTTGEIWEWAVDELDGDSAYCQYSDEVNEFATFSSVGAGSVVEDGGVYTCTNIQGGQADRVELRNAVGPINERTMGNRFLIKALPGEEGKEVLVRMTRVSGGEDTSQLDRLVVVTGEWQLVEMGPKSYPDPLNTTVCVRFFGEGTPEEATGCLVMEPQIYESYDAGWTATPDRVFIADNSRIWPGNEGAGDQILAYDSNLERVPASDMTIRGFNAANWQRVGEL